MSLGPDHFAKSKVIVPSPTHQLKGFGGRLFYYNSLRDPLFHHFPLSSPHCSPADFSLFFITVTFSEALECTHCPARVISKVTALIHTHFLQVSPRPKVPLSQEAICAPLWESPYSRSPKPPFSCPAYCFPYVMWAVSFLLIYSMVACLLLFIDLASFLGAQ